MANILIQSVPFCYGPTAIAIAIARELSHSPDCNVIALGKAPSLELLNAESELFSTVFDMTIDDDVSTALSSADLIISVCDFDFADKCKITHKDTALVFIDPLLWMWDKLPSIISKCNLYLALDFPGVSEIISKICSESVITVPQVAEFTAERNDNDIQSGKVIVNLGGMQSPLGANIALAQAMCEEIIRFARDTNDLTVDIRTSRYMAKKLQRALPTISNVNISSCTPQVFHSELAKCDYLLTVPGMSIVYESIIAQIPTAFILPLNYSQHLQIKKYRTIFPDLSEISWNHFDSFSELPDNLDEPMGVELANEMGASFYADQPARNRFQRLLNDICTNTLPPLKESDEVNISGANAIVNILRRHDYI